MGQTYQGAGVDIGAGERENVVVAALVGAQAEVAGVVGFTKPARLDLRAEGAIEHQDALARLGDKSFARAHAALASTGRRFPSRWHSACVISARLSV